MSKRAVSILTMLSAIILISNLGDSSLAQQGESGARNIFDQGAGQKPALNTQARKRSQVPERSYLALPSAQPSKTQTQKRSQVPERPKTARSSSGSAVVKQTRTGKGSAQGALKYSVVLLGQENPKGFAGSRKLMKALPQEDGKYYGMADPDQWFNLGDVIRLAFEASRPGYLYVLSLETDGKRNLLYPETGKSAYVKDGAPIMIGPFKIEPPAGADKLTVIFSYDRIKSFEEGSKDLAKDFESEIKGKDFRAIEEEEVYVATKQKVALYFAAAGEDGLKAEIDIKHN